MISKKFGNKYIVRLDKGEEILTELKKFCKNNNIRAGSIIGIGAVSKAKLGYFDLKTKEYHSKEFNGDIEVAPIAGNISTMKGEPYIHLHVNLSDTKFKSFGGHLNEAIVSVTFEAVIEVFNGKLEREYNNEFNLNLLK